MECLFVTGDLVHDLATSTDKDSSSRAIKKADDYLEILRTDKASATHPSISGQDRTVINRGPSNKSSSTSGNMKTTEHTQFTSATAPTTDMGT